MSEGNSELLQKVYALLLEFSRGNQLPPKALTQKDAALLMGVSPRHVMRMVKRGLITTVDVGGLRRIPMSEVIRLTEPPRMESSGASEERTRADGEAAARRFRELRAKKKKR
jgi:excisionase family DNA binding protein